MYIVLIIFIYIYIHILYKENIGSKIVCNEKKKNVNFIKSHEIMLVLVINIL